MQSPIKVIAVTAISALIASEIYRVRPLRKRAQANATAALLISDVLRTRAEQLDYLIKLMEEKDFELTEFDLIVLQSAQTETQD